MRKYDRLPLADARFYLGRLSASFTGGDGMAYLPSEIRDTEHRMEMRLYGIKGKAPAG